MAVGVRCPYCGRIGYTSSPQTNSICPYCGQKYHPPRGNKVGIKRKPIILTSGKKEVEKKGEKYNL
jgi:ribosomal protein S27E